MGNFVLMRIGGTPNLIGPFEDIKEAAEYLADHQLVSYTVLPLREPTNGSVSDPTPTRAGTGGYKGGQMASLPHQMPAPPPASSARDPHMRFAATYTIPGHVKNFRHDGDRMMFFIGAAINQFPDLVNKKILIIKMAREWTARESQRRGTGYHSWGLKETKDVVDAYFAKHIAEL